jgi:EAL domain-containing protein (putative c-di-GMP-specific phosphodiesterase class I)
MSVNISAQQVRLAGFVEDTLAIAMHEGFDPGRIVLELTETAMFGDVQGTITTLEGLRRHGVRIALDDFGTGYSSLGYLRRFPVDILKIARDFIADGQAEPSDWAFAHAIVALGRSLGLDIVAEGIEDADQQARLLALGCELGQGYLLCRPMDERSLEAWLRMRSSAAPTRRTTFPGVVASSGV